MTRRLPRSIALSSFARTSATLSTLRDKVTDFERGLEPELEIGMGLEMVPELELELEVEHELEHELELELELEMGRVEALLRLRLFICCRLDSGRSGAG